MVCFSSCQDTAQLGSPHRPGLKCIVLYIYAGTSEGHELYGFLNWYFTFKGQFHSIPYTYHVRCCLHGFRIDMWCSTVSPCMFIEKFHVKLNFKLKRCESHQLHTIYPKELACKHFLVVLKNVYIY